MEEKTKICPFCREEISTLARKCRYCGEMVGDPLQSERTLTADDIGQPDVTREVHGETLAQAYSALQSELRDKAKAAGKKKRKAPGFPQMKAILPWLVVGGIVLALVAFRGTIAGFVRRQMNLKQPRAVAILKDARESKRSGDLIEAIQLAKKALTVYPDVQGAQELLHDLRAEVRANIEQMYRRRNYDQVISQADRVLSVDPGNEEVQMLANLAREDKSRYSVRVVGIMTGSDGKCAAAIKTSARGEINVSEGDIFTDMRVEQIDEQSHEVLVFDEKRGVPMTIRKDGVFERKP
jgi:tetratricopeptide (TPR) repeat protein